MEKQRRQKFIFWIFIFTCVTIWVSLFFINNAWPVEPGNPIVMENQILTEAEDWPIVEQSEASGTVGKFHRDPANPDRAMLSVWFRNELFAKIMFLRSEQKPKILVKSQLAALRKENGDWVLGKYIRTSEARTGDGQALSFRLFNNDDPNNSIATRTFLLKDLMPPKK